MGLAQKSLNPSEALGRETLSPLIPSCYQLKVYHASSNSGELNGIQIVGTTPRINHLMFGDECILLF
jgi:hypothetical protein